MVRALTPHIGAYLELDGGERLGVAGRRGRAPRRGSRRREIAGRRRQLLLGCAEGALRLRRSSPAGGRAMAADAYLRGHRPAAPCA